MPSPTLTSLHGSFFFWYRKWGVTWSWNAQYIVGTRYAKKRYTFSRSSYLRMKMIYIWTRQSPWFTWLAYMLNIFMLVLTCFSTTPLMKIEMKISLMTDEQWAIGAKVKNHHISSIVNKLSMINQFMKINLRKRYFIWVPKSKVR